MLDIANCYFQIPIQNYLPAKIHQVVIKTSWPVFTERFFSYLFLASTLKNFRIKYILRFHQKHRPSNRNHLSFSVLNSGYAFLLILNSSECCTETSNQTDEWIFDGFLEKKVEPFYLLSLKNLPDKLSTTTKFSWR